MGPEQADAAIDQDPTISQYFSWWNRRGTEVIRGHTTLLPIGKEILYVEPIFLRSQQNALPQLKKVIVVYRGKPVMAGSLEQAIRLSVTGGSTPKEDLFSSEPATKVATSGDKSEPMKESDSTAAQPRKAEGGR